uniref:Uncharacterized protein n=1 Tax=Dipteris conjugata TaxID=32108 RepID=A0A385GPH0_9MONI|nr:hypothetical protein [Dipteris conjugata]
MSSVHIFLQMFLYYPLLFLAFYIYAVFVIPMKSSISRNRYWLSVKSFLERSDVRYFLTGKKRKRK